MELAAPPSKKATVRLVGAPVKARDTPELTESDACNPYTIRAIPTTSRAIPIPLFIILLSLNSDPRTGGLVVGIEFCVELKFLAKGSLPQAHFRCGLNFAANPTTKL